MLLHFRMRELKVNQRKRTSNTIQDSMRRANLKSCTFSIALKCFRRKTDFKRQNREVLCDSKWRVMFYKGIEGKSGQCIIWILWPLLMKREWLSESQINHNSIHQLNPLRILNDMGKVPIVNIMFESIEERQFRAKSVRWQSRREK